MNFSVIKRPNAITRNEQSIRIEYVIVGTPEDGDQSLDIDDLARNDLVNTADNTYEGMTLTDAEIEPLFAMDINESGGSPVLNGKRVWLGTAVYKEHDWTPPDVGEDSFSFETGGATEHITHSLNTKSTDNAIDHGGAIGVTDNGVEGVDITVPSYNFTITKRFSSITAAYKQHLASLTGSVNSDTFQGFAAGEVLFQGASGSKRGDEDWEIVYNFSAKVNANAPTVGSLSWTDVTKQGWEYFWVQYKESVDTVQKRGKKEPIGAYVEQVYPEQSFANIFSSGYAGT